MSLIMELHYLIYLETEMKFSWQRKCFKLHLSFLLEMQKDHWFSKMLHQGDLKVKL